MPKANSVEFHSFDRPMRTVRYDRYITISSAYQFPCGAAARAEETRGEIIAQALQYSLPTASDAEVIPVEMHVLRKRARSEQKLR
jgi:hypothetical protein